MKNWGKAHTRNLSGKIWENPENSLIFSEESSRVIHEMGNIALYELGHMFSTIQCHIHASSTCREGPAFCRCGMCLRDEATTRRIHARFQTVIVPYCFARFNRPKGKKCGESRGNSITGGSWTPQEVPTNVATIQSQSGGKGDEKYRNSQLAHGRTEAYCRYLHYLTTIDISYVATWEQRHRCESTITLSCVHKIVKKDQRTQIQVFRIITQGGRQNFFPKNERTRQRPFDEELQAKFEWMSQNWRTHFAQPSSSSSSSQTWWQHEHEHQDTQWRDHHWLQLAAGTCCATPTNKITNGKIENGEPAVFFRSLAYRHSERSARDERWTQNTSVLSCRARLSTFLSCTHVMLRVVCCAIAHPKNTPSSQMFHSTLLGVPDTFSSFCSSPPQTTPTTRPLTGIRSTPPCDFAGRKSVWLPGRITSSHMKFAPRSHAMYHYGLVHTPVPMTQTMKIPAVNAAANK